MNTEETPSAMFSLRLPAELAAQIDTIAARERRSRNGQIVLFLEQAVSRPITEQRNDQMASPAARRGART